MRFNPTAYTVRGEHSLVVAFLDLKGFAAQSARITDREIADGIDGYYSRVAERVTKAGGYVVKFIGDGALIVFRSEAADMAIETFLALKSELDDWLEQLGWSCTLTIKIHVGDVIVGPFGGRLDVIGREVNTTAMLDSTGVALSVPAFRALGPEMRQRFKKHTPPVTYIRHEDPRRFRYRPA
ncbi:MAG TPA: adenylate/guanylate cyclase domain-containing protein [Kofleriaceae bacterium]|nr:adenylate/guanylate cyclase domain-containing protein [Kofleriaceae bacterium]